MHTNPPRIERPTSGQRSNDGDARTQAAVEQATKRLRVPLRLNAAFSLVSGAVLLVAGGPIGSLMDVDQVWLLRLMGVGLALFGADVWLVASRPTRQLIQHSAMITAADFAWVAATVVVIALGLVNTAGAVLCALVALAVDGFGTAQFFARRSLVRTLAPPD